ncbi:DUF6478 family protein [Acidimangrovimonas sediminis]|uniref:DUF6478 family protein n=2 Tax=Albidovulum sediminis TaxID=3066345 RepID=A0ABT2NPN1_9RHOB|nr:DUF6478 family protein [Defluviimonas sediminis]MCT8330058.1 DUF6478 family protein [Defluviimonas sediminis]
MAGSLSRLIGEFMHRRMLARVRRNHSLAEHADTSTLRALRALRAGGRQLRAELDVTLDAVDSRLGHPKGGSARIQRKPGMDWAWRPELWSGPVRPAGVAPAPRQANLSRHGKVYHDCGLGEIALRQVANQGADDLNPYAYLVEVFGFSGTFLSLVVDLPADALAGLARRHVIRLEARIEVERPIRVYARLNLRYGPNTEQITRELDQTARPPEAEFDLAYADFAADQIDRAWIDLFFENPAMNRMTLKDLTLMRLVRAEY